MKSTKYNPPRWLWGGNAQTIYPYLMSQPASIPYRRERWELDDGDFIDVDWLDGEGNKPLVVLFHGLEGGSRSHYALSMMRYLQSRQWNGVVIHFRGCSGYPNRLPRAYHAGDSAEIDWMLKRIASIQSSQLQKSNRTIYAMGVSLGGNALLKWLGEQGKMASQYIAAVAAISVPMDLVAAGNVLDKGFNQLYTRHFLSSLKQKIVGKQKKFPGLFDIKAVTQCATLYEFDNLVTAPLHGFRDTDEYWTTSSSKPWLRVIEVPTLVLNAKNDPFLPAHALPEYSAVSSAVTLEYPEQGGHVGFLHGSFPGKLMWLPERILRFFEGVNCNNQ
ncbi:MAG: alpha/beta fold hydrolase [Nitrosomonas sp.]|nr:MAG: alpha/beta fold hydrolase [Nitrosomonas sp.]